MKILWLESLAPGQVGLSSDLFKALLEPQRIILNVGLFKAKLDAMLIKDCSKGAIALPKKLSNVYTIPTDIPYECFIQNREIHIGPVIAYVALGNFIDLKHDIYFSILPKFMDYHLIKGLIFICTSDSIDVNAGIIGGYYFDPKEQAPEKVWKFGKFPLPKAIYNRSYMSQEKISGIQKKIGDTVFNSYWYNLNKWDIWNRLSKDEILKKHLPYTERFSGIKQLANLLQQYNSVYLKPCNSSRGRGIMQMSKTNEGIFLVNDRMQKWYLEDYQSLTQFLKQIVKTPYIVQQAVPFKINHQHVDFRLILQRDGSKEWACSGLMARIAPQGGIITNMRGKAKAMLGREGLITLFKLNEETAEKIEREMTDVVIKAAQRYIQEDIHLGDLAADIILDANLHIWLLELQLNHAMYGRTETLPPEFFEKTLTIPFQYAKALAGFAGDGK